MSKPRSSFTLDLKTNDFTVNGYIDLLEIASSNHRFIKYTEIVFDEPFILLRHDCDHSLNRALHIAKIEYDRNVKSTFFINPHCHYYNLHEEEQFKIVSKIIEMGHDIGLHFDSVFHSVTSEDQVDEFVFREAGWIKEWFGVEPKAFSFHSPSNFCLQCENDSYGGLINCYAKRFKSQIKYLSDSNGYWRFDRPDNVLNDEKFRYVQVLTHPEHWQNRPMYPRERTFRSIYGRARSTLKRYDVLLSDQSRVNVFGKSEVLLGLKEIVREKYDLLDYLWNLGELEALFMLLWRLILKDLYRLSKVKICMKFGVSEVEVNSLFGELNGDLDASLVFEEAYQRPWWRVARMDKSVFDNCNSLRQNLLGGADISPQILEEGCIAFCEAIKMLHATSDSRSGVKNFISDKEAVDMFDTEPMGQKLDTQIAYHVEEVLINPQAQWERFKLKLLKKNN